MNGSDGTRKLREDGWSLYPVFLIDNMSRRGFIKGRLRGRRRVGCLYILDIGGEN